MELKRFLRAISRRLRHQVFRPLLAKQDVDPYEMAWECRGSREEPSP
jgi:hypothetical protein